MKAKKKVLLLHEQDARHNPFDFDLEMKAAPAWIQDLIENYES